MGDEVDVGVCGRVSTERNVDDMGKSFRYRGGDAAASDTEAASEQQRTFAQHHADRSELRADALPGVARGATARQCNTRADPIDKLARRLI